MHEFSLMTALMRRIRDIAEEHQADRITAVRVRLGALSHLSPEHFQEHFTEAAKGSPAEQARLFIQVDSDIRSPDAQVILLESIELE